MGQKKGKVTHLNVEQCEHGLFALVCMVMHIFTLYSFATSPQLTTTIIIFITTTTTTAFNVTTSITTTATITPSTRPPSSPTSTVTCQPPQQHVQPSSKGLKMHCVSSPRYVFLHFFISLLLLLTVLLQAPSLSTIHHSLSPHHRNNNMPTH